MPRPLFLQISPASATTLSTLSVFYSWPHFHASFCSTYALDSFLIIKSSLFIDFHKNTLHQTFLSKFTKNFALRDSHSSNRDLLSSFCLYFHPLPVQTETHMHACTHTITHTHIHTHTERHSSGRVIPQREMISFGNLRGVLYIMCPGILSYNSSVTLWLAYI